MYGISRVDEPQGQLLGQCADGEPGGSLKVSRLYGKRFATQREAIYKVIAWLTFCNHRKLHPSLGYVSPMRFEQTRHTGQSTQAE